MAGTRVACECGDVVVADVVLGDDPVVRMPCAGDGLLVQAPAGRALTVDGGPCREAQYGSAKKTAADELNAQRTSRRADDVCKRP